MNTHDVVCVGICRLFFPSQIIIFLVFHHKLRYLFFTWATSIYFTWQKTNALKMMVKCLGDPSTTLKNSAPTSSNHLAKYRRHILWYLQQQKKRMVRQYHPPPKKRMHVAQRRNKVPQEPQQRSPHEKKNNFSNKKKKPRSVYSRPHSPTLHTN